MRRFHDTTPVSAVDEGEIRPTTTPSQGSPSVHREDGAPAYRPALFDSLASGERCLGRVFLSTPRIAASAQTTLVAQGEAHDQVYWLRAGWAYRYRFVLDGRRQILSIHLPGDLIGLDCMLMRDQLDTIETLTKCTYCALDHEALRATLAIPDVALRIAWAMTQERQRIDSHATWIGRCSAEERITAFFLELYERLRHLQLLNGKSFLCPLTQRHVADCLGITIVHANRVLKRLQASGIVSMQYRTVAIHDLKRLRQVAHPAVKEMPIHPANVVHLEQQQAVSGE